MTKIATVPIHLISGEVRAESWVPAETITGWVAVGWAEGRLPELAEAAEREREAFMAAAAVAAKKWAAEHPSPEELEQRRLVDEVTVPEVTPEPTSEASQVAVDEQPIAQAAPEPEIAGRRTRGTGEPVPTGTNPTTPEEG